MIVYGIKNCDTVKKARRWLEQHDIAYQFHDFRSDGLDEATVDQWLKTLDWEQLLNKRSTSWRQLSDQQRDGLTEQKAKQLILANPTLIKRPVISANGRLWLGFNESQYQELLK
jgi:arsenate reductase